MANRPLREFMGAYNIPASDDPLGTGWREKEDIQELDPSEFYEVRETIVQALQKHGTVSDLPPADFYVYDDKFFDRTQKVEIDNTEKLTQLLPAAVAEVQSALREFPLWRVMFIGHGHDEQAEEQFFVVYPDVVRIAQLSGETSVDGAVRANAAIRLRHERERSVHREERKAALRRAIAAAIEQSRSSEEPLKLVAWYPTISLPNSDWGWEGKPGTSVWVLVRDPIEDADEVSASNVSCDVHWSAEDGTSSNSKEDVKGPAYQLLHLSDDELVRKELRIRIRGRAQVLRPPQ